MLQLRGLNHNVDAYVNRPRRKTIGEKTPQGCTIAVLISDTIILVERGRQYRVTIEQRVTTQGGGLFVSNGLCLATGVGVGIVAPVQHFGSSARHIITGTSSATLSSLFQRRLQSPRLVLDPKFHLLPNQMVHP